jgi:glucosamine--fructose-6-phosphate aminotransferase (isomerizing)
MSTPQWHEDWFPELRAERPWVMEEMIDAEPPLAARIASNKKLAQTAARIAKQVTAAHAAGTSISVVGCGTSEHAARAVAMELDEALGHRGVRVAGRQALEAAIDTAPAGLTIGISHDNGTRATLLALKAAREAGQATALITGNSEGSCSAFADIVLVTPEKDKSWCHTIGYLSPMVAGAVIAGHVAGKELDAAALELHLDECRALKQQASEIARGFRGIDRLIVVGGGYDRITADELVLKVEEGLHLPSSARDLETFGHGHLPACDERSGLVVVATEHRGRARRTDRGRLLLRAARHIGMPCAAILVPAVEGSWGRELTNAGRILLPHAAKLTPTTSALTASAMALQLLTLELVHDRGTYPDLIRREEAPWREAAAILEGTEEW